MTLYYVVIIRGIFLDMIINLISKSDKNSGYEITTSVGATN